jgi:preprotein translocase subunit SecA
MKTSRFLHHINQAISAHGIMHRDVDYVVKDGEVIIVDEFTGRLMFGRRYNEGLHQAIEAKEGVKVASESKTLATITFQNLFSLYGKLSGMTGTARTEGGRSLERSTSWTWWRLPTNKPVHAPATTATLSTRPSCQDKRRHRPDYLPLPQKGQPVLVGTVYHRKSASCSAPAKAAGHKHKVLTPNTTPERLKSSRRPASIGAVTIATNMAGRGTDIMLGGNAEYLAKSLSKSGLRGPHIAEATGYGDTTTRILAARKRAL